MQRSNKTICPLCRGEVPASAIWCIHCGRNLPPMMFAYPNAQPATESYEIIRDGPVFRVVLQGKLRIGGLSPEDAQSIFAVLNGMN